MEILERKFAPSIRQIEKIEIIKADQFQLDNGMPVYVVNAGEQEILRAEFLFRNHYSNAPEVLTAASTNRMLAEGTSRRTALQLADAIDYYGGFFETEEHHDYNSVNLYTLTKHFDKTLPVMKEILCEPEFPEKELGVYKQNTRQHLMVSLEKVSYLSKVHFQEALFGMQHPYGYRSQAAEVEALTRDELKSYYQKNYDLSQCAIILAGKINDRILNLLNEQFGNEGFSNPSNGQRNFNIEQRPSDEKIHFVKKPGAIQCAIRIGRLLFNKTHPDYLKLSVLNTVFGGYFGSRLMSNIREDKGYTYGIGAGLVSMMQAGYMIISTEVAKEVSEAAVREIYFEMEKLQQELIPESELRMVKNFMTGTLLRSMDGAANLADRWRSIMLYNLGYEFYQQYFATIQDVTAQDLLDLAKKYYNKSDFYQLLAGDK